MADLGKVELEFEEIASGAFSSDEKGPVRGKPKEVAPHRVGFQQTLRVRDAFDG